MRFLYISWLAWLIASFPYPSCDIQRRTSGIELSKPIEFIFQGKTIFYTENVNFHPKPGDSDHQEKDFSDTVENLG